MLTSKINNAKNIFYLLMAATIVGACATSKSDGMEKNKSIEFSNDHSVLTGQVVKKEFFNKVGKATGTVDLYLRCSVQDYFIKFCESSVSKEEIESLDLGEFDAIKVEAEIVDGEWDSCNEDIQVQSRVGRYVVIYKILA